MGSDIIEGVSNIGIPCFSHQLIWKGLPDNITSAVLYVACFAQADIGWSNRVPEHWEILHHQYPTEKTSVHCGAYSW